MRYLLAAFIVLFALSLGAACGNIFYILVINHVDNFGGPILAFVALLAVLGSVALVEGLESKQRGERQ